MKKAMTMTQKILAGKAGLTEVQPGQLIEAGLDLILGNDITTPPAIRAFRRMDVASVFDPDKIALVPDHFTPNKDIESARQAKVLRDFAKEQKIRHYFELGRMGIEHALLPEQGLVTAGDCIIGADSHTCTYGALGAFSTGVGSTDMAAAMACGKTWFQVPKAIRFELTGFLQPHVSGKDVILYLIGRIGVDGALYQSMEFGGSGLAALTMDDRFTIANMAVEAGAKNGIFETDGQTFSYLKERAKRVPDPVFPDPGAYQKNMEIRMNEIPPMVALPSLPSNTKPAGMCGDIFIDQVVIGSCTNGRISDMRTAAGVLEGKRVHPDVRCLIIPATQEVWLQCVREGLMDIFISAGAAVSTPTCGPCLGGHMGILAAGERCVATTNRNFTGRMGDPSSEVYLASPYVAACSAVRGKIAAE